MSGGPVPVWKKYTRGSQGIWERIRRLLVVAPNRSSGNPYVPYYRVPSPNSEPNVYVNPTTIPAADIVNNPYYKRDTRKAHPNPSVFTQENIGSLLKLGSETNSRLEKGEEGVKQLAVANENKIQLVDALKSAPSSVINGEILGLNGAPVIAPNLNKKFRVKIISEAESGCYNEDYPVRVFAIDKQEPAQPQPAQ